MASLILGNIGSSLLGPIGGFLGSALGSWIDQWLFAPKPEDQEGPRLDDLMAVRAEPGAPIPLLFGADRLPGIVVGTTDFIETVNKERVGGKGGPKQTVITYTYHVDIDYMLCEGPILGVGRIWADGNLVRGTSYQMASDTAEHPENIGGIPYPASYRAHIYQNALLPRDFADITSDGVSYRMDSSGQRMVEGAPITSPVNRPGYNRDTTSGYYIPKAASHAYTGEKFQTDTIGDYQTQTVEGTKVSGTSTAEVAIGGSVVDVYSLDALGVDTTGERYTQIIWNIDWDINASLGLTNSSFNFGLEMFTEGNNGGLDINDPSTKVFSDITVVSPGGFEGIPLQSLTVTVAANVKFIRTEYDFAVVFPLFADIVTTVNNVSIKASSSSSADRRDWVDYWNLYDAINDWSKYAVLGFDKSDSVTVYRGTDDQIIDPVMEAAMTDISEEYLAYTNRAHIVFGSLQLESFGNRIPNMTFEVVQFDDARIGPAITDLMSRAEVDASNYDVTALPASGVASHIMGYSIGRKTSFRAAMETMIEAFRIDAAEIGNEIVFRPKDRAVDYTIEMGLLSAIEAGSGPGDLVRLTFRNTVEMPRSLTVRFKDPERDYQPNTAFYRRQQGGSVQESAMELASVLPPAEAKKYARFKMRDLWLERVSTSVEGPHELVYLYPSDIVRVDGTLLGETSFTMKLTTMTRGANGIISLEGVLREQTIYERSAAEVITVPATSFWANPQSVDIELYQTIARFYDGPPLMEGRDDGEGFYVGLGGLDARWRGSVLYRTLGDPSTGAYEKLPVASANSIVTGTALDALSGTVAEVVDTVSSIEVAMLSPSFTLSSITPDELFDGGNACLIGNEVVCFMTATLIGTGLYRLTNFLRGRRGTDTTAILNGHTGFEPFTMVDTFTWKNFTDDSNHRGVSIAYKPVSYGAFESQILHELFTHNSERLRPLPPVQISGTRDGSDNLTITWVRADRVYQGWPALSDIANSETLEQYVVLIKDGAATVRTIIVDDTTQTTYTAAQQTTDTLTPGDPVTVEIQQVSSVIGWGNSRTEVV